MRVSTYSPLFGISPLTKPPSRLTDELNQFEFVFE